MDTVSVYGADNHKLQTFLRTKAAAERPNKIHIKNVIIDHKPSTVAHSTRKNEIIKLVKARKWHEYAKIFWAHSRTHKEVQGAQIFNSLHLKTPKIYEMGISLPIYLKSKYIGYYIMEDLSEKKLIECQEFFDNSDPSNPLRMKIIHNICDGLIKISKTGFVFTDFHLANVFADNQGELTWIDTGITRYRSKKKHTQKYQDAYKRFLNYFRSTCLTENEKESITSILKLQKHSKQ